MKALMEMKLSQACNDGNLNDDVLTYYGLPLSKL